MSTIEVLGQCEWQRAPGAIRGSGDAIVGKVTRIRVDGVEGFVREHVRNPYSFLMSSNERLSESRRGPKGQQVLELAAPHSWERISAAVASVDRLKRPVVRNARWTMTTARRAFRMGVQS